MTFDIYMPTGTFAHAEHLLRRPSSRLNMSEQKGFFGKLRSKLSNNSDDKNQKMRFATPYGKRMSDQSMLPFLNL